MKHMDGVTILARGGAFFIHSFMYYTYKCIVMS